MNPNVVFFWALFGPVCAFIALAILAAFLCLIGTTVDAAVTWMRKQRSS